jgi:hypothetical protein
VQLVCLDEIFSLTATAVEDLVQPPRRAGEVGDNEAAVAALARRLDAGDDSALGLPALGGVAEVAEAPGLVGARLGATEAVSSARSATRSSRTRLPARPKT